MALLTLQLRGAVQEAEAAEAAVADELDLDAALWQLRSKLHPLIEERRRAHDLELQAAHADASDRVEAARAEAAAIVTEAEGRAADRAAAARAAAASSAARPDAPADSEEETGAADEADEAAHQADPLAADPEIVAAAQAALAAAVVFDEEPPGFVQDADDGVGPTHAESGRDGLTGDPEGLPPIVSATPTSVIAIHGGLLEEPDTDGDDTDDDSSSSRSSPAVRPMLVTLDADAFAKAFAAAIAPVLAQRARAQQPPPHLPQHYPYPFPPQYYLPTQPARKTSFWSHAWHPDVLLSAVAMIIVLVVLVAWAG